MTLPRSVAVSPPVSDRSPIQLRGASFTLLVLRMGDPRDPTFYTRLADKIGQAPNFYRHAPVVVDLQDLAEAPPFNLAELGRRLRQHGLIPLAVQHGTEAQNHAAQNAGFAVLPEGRRPAAGSDDTPPASPRPVVSAARRPEPGAAQEPAPVGSRVISSPVRSGRQVYAHQSDLVVLSSISPGAELLADGHIHVYGALRGRALAGVGGDRAARIFCLGLEAELISIAGFWRVRDDLPEDLIAKPVQIYLADERVVVEPLA
jgi:septum site-determining protein MinC